MTKKYHVKVNPPTKQSLEYGKLIKEFGVDKAIEIMEEKYPELKGKM